MEEGTKKIVMIVIIVVCLITAGTIYYKTSGSGGGGTTIKSGEATVTVKCKSCGNEWQVDKKEYIDVINLNGGRVGVVCPKCNKPAGYEKN